MTDTTPTTLTDLEILIDLPSVRFEPEDGAHAIPDAATGETIAWVADVDSADLDRAIEVAASAQIPWAAADDSERRAVLRAIADDVDAHAEELARLLSRETGKPLNGLNARFELGACSLWLRSNADIDLPDSNLFSADGHGADLRYEPLGVVGAINPWNWPMMIAVWQIAPALRMGNAVVVKPSENSPLSVLALAAVFQRHLPEGLLQVVPGGGAVGARLAAHPKIAKLMFTGSTATGRRIVEASAKNLARLTLELGGNDPAIVLPDVDPAAIAQGLFWGAFVNTGQTCAAIKRLYVHEDVYEAVVDELVALAESTPLGNGLDESSILGPLQNAKQFDIVSRLVDDARARGARVATGGQPAPELGANFYRPTIVADIDQAAPLVQEEQFGPALPVVKYTDLDEAIRLANSTEQGLCASVWTTDDATARSVAARIEAGTVWINQHAAPNPIVPFGGVKGSGYGLEFGIEGLKSVSRPKVISH